MNNDHNVAQVEAPGRPEHISVPLKWVSVLRQQPGAPTRLLQPNLLITGLISQRLTGRKRELKIPVTARLS